MPDLKLKASIIILTYNNLDFTRQCLDSIFQKTCGVDYEVILVDNNSEDGTQAYLQALAAEHSNLRLILNQVNTGFAGGNNQGAAAAAGEIIVFLNNDTIVTQGWLTGLIRHLQDPQVGMVGPVTNSSGNETRIQVSYPALDGMDDFAQQYTHAHQNITFEVRMLAFLCVAIRRDVYTEIGPLDELFGVGMFEDDDYALRLKEKGYKILCAEDVFIHHWGSATFSRLEPTHYWDIFRQNLEKFENKWHIQWTPPQLRAEFVPEKMRQLLDGSLWFSQTVHHLDQTIDDLQAFNAKLRADNSKLQMDNSKLQAHIQENKKAIEYLNNDIAKAVESINYLNSQLNNIYQSNGWVFLQKLLSIRRAIIPEGSRKEQILKRILGFLRHPFTRQTTTIPNNLRPTLVSSSPTEAKVPVTAQPAAEKTAWFSNRYPWPLVSVILPVYNHADMLGSAARSVLNSTYPNLELIVIDDGSSDEIEPVLQALACNPRVRILRQPNQKLPRALTHAHKIARGQLITWTSADNIMTPEAIQTLVSAILTQPDAVLVYADIGVIDDLGNPLLDGSYRPQNLDIEQKDVVRLHQDALPLGLEVDNYINACFLFRREAALALEGHYSDDLRGLEDYDFWLRMQKAGRFHHIGNRQPLYYYRVHQRSMSHELLSQDLNPHLQRGQKMIQYEGQRREYARRRWTLLLDESLPPEESSQIMLTAQQLPVDLAFQGSGWEPEHKELRLVSGQTQVSERLILRSFPYSWQLEWSSPWTEDLQSINFWKGVEINPLARKSRDLRPNHWEIPQAGQRPVLGFHLGLADYPLDVDSTRQVIAHNPWIYFVFVDEPGNDHPALGQEVVQGLENAIYLGSHDFGKIYQLYACLEAFWLPPYTTDISIHAYQSSLALAYAAARPLIIPRGLTTVPAPYQLYYHLPDESLGFIASLERSSIDCALLDSYLACWQPATCLKEVLAHADAASQEIALPRPDFGLLPAPVTPPTSWQPAHLTDGDTLKCALVVEKLDKGGLEEMVAQLAHWLPQHGITCFVLCAQSGGTTAERLQAEGVPVYIANGERRTMLEVLRKEAPNVISTNWAGLSFLEAASEAGIPVVETIHNTYVWFIEQSWQEEKLRSRYFTHAVAVSDLVRRYYLKWNNTIHPEWVTLVPNGIDPHRIQMVDRGHACQELQLPRDAFLFVSLASYDSRKNQIGLLTAFNELAKHHPQAHLLCAGNILDPRYNEEVLSYSQSLPASSKIFLHSYRPDTGLLLSAANAFVVPSFFEGWSLAATEALMAGVPLIHSECGSAQELIGKHGERGIVVPNPACSPMDLTLDIVLKYAYQTRQANTDALTEAMTQMIEKRDQWAALRPTIRDFALANFSLDNTLNKYAQTFRQIAFQPVKKSMEK